MPSTQHNNGRRSQLLYCTRILRNVCQADRGGTVRRSLADQGAMPTLLQFVARRFPDSADEFDIRIRADALLLVAALCDNDHHHKACCVLHAVPLTCPGAVWRDRHCGAAAIPHLQARAVRTEPLVPRSVWRRHCVLLVRACRCVHVAEGCRSAVVGSALNEAVFLEQQGVFALLDALEHAPAALQATVLASLLDLCHNATATEHVRHWRSRDADRFDACRLLLRLWRREQELLLVPLAEDGILAGAPGARHVRC